MDIRIHGESLEGANALETSRAQEAPQAGQSDPLRGFKPLEGGQDSVQLSSLSARISEINQQQDVEASNRVAALAALYARGNYKVDAGDLSRALVSHALSGVADGGPA
jgi:anti-sigma28 factor (negative regulator of flagellin synthesis)